MDTRTVPAFRHLALALFLGLGLLVQAGDAAADAADLKARQAQLAPALRDNPYGRPMHIDSSVEGDTLRGEVHAMLDHPFTKVREAFREPSQWCSVLILPFNVKYCRAGGTADAPVLMLRIGRKYDQPVERAFKLRLNLRQVAASPDYMETRLEAAEGPVGTRDYRIVFSAIPVGANRTFLRLDYSYAYGATSRLAMRAYLATAGADKVGFTITGRGADGKPEYIGGMRSVIERNVMRYYLAIDAYLGSLSAPADQRAERSIQTWFDATEQYAVQLHEMDRTTYVNMKRNEVARQKELELD